MGWLLNLLGVKPGVLLAGGIAAALALATMGWLKWSLDVARADAARIAVERDQAADLARRNAAEAFRIADWNSRAMAQVAADAASVRARHTTIERIRTEVIHAARETPAACPVAPSLRAALDGVRAARAAAGGPHRAAGDPGAPAGLPAGP